MQKSAGIRKLAGELMALSYQGPDEQALEATSWRQILLPIVKEKGVTYVEVSGERIEMQQNLAKAELDAVCQGKGNGAGQRLD